MQQTETAAAGQITHAGGDVACNVVFGMVGTLDIILYRLCRSGAATL